MPEYKTGTVVRIGGLLTTKLFTKTSSINWLHPKYKGQPIRPWTAMKFQTQCWRTARYASQAHSFDSL
jgi:hypothetical protein